MNPPLLLASPAMVIVLRWTSLLALGWVAHRVLRRQHPRWRLILWRGIFCFGLLLPLLNFCQIPGLRIPITGNAMHTTEFADSLSPVAARTPTQPVASVARPPQPPIAADSASKTARFPQVSTPPKPVSLESGLLLIWVLGCVCGTYRLFRLHLQLSRLRIEGCLPSPDLQRLAKQVQVRLGVRREVDVRISDAVTSPFVCGLSKPAIILPSALAQALSLGELGALLNHEIAHLRQYDLVWCLAWRWMKVLCWFHPLVWQVPAAHNLACEQEADRIASGQFAEQDSYTQLLARLALRVLALPAVETKLTLNGSSQIARRLIHLGQEGGRAWSWKHSVAGFGLVGLLFLFTAGCDFSKDAAAPKNSARVEFKNVPVVVQDETGKPIEGATVLPDGFRVKGIHGADAYHWGSNQFGGPVKATTDHEGKAYVRYPVEGIPGEKEFTGELIFSVSHPEFATARLQEYSVDSPEKPVQLTRGIHLEVSGYFGSDHQPVTELSPNLSQEMLRPEDWRKTDNGVYEFHKLSPGGHMLQLMGRLPTGEIVYSEAFAFTAEKGKPCQIALEMRPGIRLEGRVDDNVPRPVKNGRVMIDVRPKEYPALLVINDFYDLNKKFGMFNFWHSCRPISADGTFVFESVPPGELDVVVLCDGFASKSNGQLQNRVMGTLHKGPVMAVPEPFPLAAPTTKIEVTTEPTATLEFTATTRGGKPIEGAWVRMFPSVFRMRGIFGLAKNSSEEPYREIPHLSEPAFGGKTDQDGKVVIKHLPAEIFIMEVDHARYQVPLQEPKGWRDRHIRTDFSPGMTNKLTLALEPKGSDFIGSSR